MKFDYDLFVIGAGSGGVRAARMAAATGAKVAVAEDSDLGGTCVNVGCVPKKLFVYASHFGEEFRNAEGFGWSAASPNFDWQTLLENKNTEISRLNRVYGSLLDNANVDLIEGRAFIADENTVTVGEAVYTAEKIIIAVGGWPFVPEFPGSEHVITSNEIFFLDKLPKRAVIVGGGYIAAEFAGILNGLGVDTQLVYRKELFLRGFDQEVREFLRSEMDKKGVHLRFNDNVTQIEKHDDNSLALTLESGTELETDLVMYATGRKPRTEELWHESMNIACHANGTIKVNDAFQTSIPSIFALGDVSGGMELTPVAIAEGMAFVDTHFKNKPRVVDYSNIPTAIFTQPNVGTVGLSEAQAHDEFADDVVVFTSEFKHMKHTLSGDSERTFMKLVVQKSTDKVLGIHMVGGDAGEVIQGLAVAMKAGATKAHLDSTIGIHPTAAEEFVTMREAVR